MIQILKKNNLEYLLSIRKYLILSVISLALVLSSFSSEVSAAHPNAPGNFSAIAVSTTQIDLSWTAPNTATPITGYKIMYVVDKGSFQELVSNTGTTADKIFPQKFNARSCLFLPSLCIKCYRSR